MRSSVRHLDSCPPADEATGRNAPTGTGALPALCDAIGSADLAAQIEAARNAARTRSLRTAMLLHSWLSEHD
jgi:hypothetical protein